MAYNTYSVMSPTTSKPITQREIFSDIGGAKLTGISEQDFLRRQAFQDISMRRQRGMINDDQEMSERIAIDVKYPPSNRSKEANNAMAQIIAGGIPSIYSSEFAKFNERLAKADVAGGTEKATFIEEEGARVPLPANRTLDYRQSERNSLQSSTLSESGQYYKSGNDVYRASDNAHITMDNPDPSLDWNKLGLNFALLPQGQAPTQKETTGNPVIDNALAQLDNIGDENAKTFSAILKEGIQPFFDNLMKNGQTINPNIEITPEKAAEFLTQAQKEISPYYAGQMKIAREGLLREAGYTSDEIAQSEAKIEKQYGQSLRTLSGNMAESGFALSGQRQEGERNLAEDTQSSIDSARRAAEYNASNSARTFASEWGGSNTPQFNYGSAPKVQAGQEKFSRSLDMKPFYSISDSVLSGLTGSQQYNEQAQTKSRASELEGLYRTQEANKQRLLTL